VPMVGFWFGKLSPNINLYLERFVNEANDLYNNSVTWVNEANDTIVSKFLPLCCSVDSSARCKLLNMKQFNGFFSCPWCYHPGISVNTAGTRCEVRYPVTEDDYTLRTDNEELEDMQVAVNQNICSRGFKGSSVLVNLPRFKLVKQCVPDYMHCVLLGVTRTLTCHFLEDSGELYYIGTPQKIQEIDNRLLSIKPPCNVARFPQTIKDKKLWKASEWRLWLLMYSMPCLNGVLPEKYYKNLVLFVEAIYILLQEDITVEEVQQADLMLFHFVCDMQLLYGKKFCVYNVHLLTHLSQAVKKFGPLWTHSLFAFENANGNLLRHVKGTTGVPQQCAKKYIMFSSLPTFVSTNQISIGFNTEQFLGQMLGKPNRFYCFKSNDTTVLGQGVVTQLSLSEKNALRSFNCNVDDEIVFYDRAIVLGTVLTTRGYSQNKKSDNSFFYTKQNAVGNIRKIV
jgi:hypothetical protein